MRIVLHNPVPDSIYANRTILLGYKHAIEDMGYDLRILTPDTDQQKLFDEFKPHIFITSLSVINLKYINFLDLKKHKKRGMKVLSNMSFWKSPISSLRINENPGLAVTGNWIKLITSGSFADAYFNSCEQDDYRMDGFKKATGFGHHTVLLAADKTIRPPAFSKAYSCDLSFIGTLLPEKKQFIKDNVIPLKKKYDVRLYGQDWNLRDKTAGWIQRAGQYFNIPYVKSFRKATMTQTEELSLHRSSTIALNIHEDYQKIAPGDLNERTFKIIYAGGFQLIDNVPSIRRHFAVGKEIMVARNSKDWYDRIDFYINNPKKRQEIIDAGRRRIMRDHTYHNRVKQLIIIYKSLK